MKLPAVLAAAVFVLAGCAGSPPSTVEPGTGPAATAEPSGPVEGEPSEPPADQPLTGSFDQKIVYPDGVAVEVIRIRHGKLSDTGVGDAGQKAGDPIQLLSIRVANGSKAAIDVGGASGTMTYGPDGEEASIVSDSENGTEDMQGKVLPKRAKTGVYGYAVPTKYLGDVQLEFSFDFDHQPAIFTGSIK